MRYKDEVRDLIFPPHANTYMLALELEMTFGVPCFNQKYFIKGMKMIRIMPNDPEAHHPAPILLLKINQQIVEHFFLAALAGRTVKLVGSTEAEILRNPEERMEEERMEEALAERLRKNTGAELACSQHGMLTRVMKLAEREAKRQWHDQQR